MKKLFAIAILSITVFACADPEPREPITVKSGTFYKESVKRNKKILAEEEAAIQKIMDTDTATYYPSEEGFWYTYIFKTEEDTYTPQEEDLVTLTYNVQTISGKPIYTKQQIGTVTYKVDKQENLFLGLRKAVKLLKKGEEGTFYFPSSLAYGYVGDHKEIGINVPLKSNLKIIDIQKNQDSIPH